MRRSEGYRLLYDYAHPESNTSWQTECYKSRLLGRMLIDGKPPTRTKPPIEVAGPAWWLLPGGDPFA